MMLATCAVKMIRLMFEELMDTMSNVLDFRFRLAPLAVHFNQGFANPAIFMGRVGRIGWVMRMGWVMSVGWVMRMG